MEQYVNDAVGLLRQLIATPSVSRDEQAAADIMEEHLKRWNLPNGREGNNLWVGCQDWDNSRPTLMLNAHIDTVKPVPTWTRNPYEPTIEGDTLYGLGSNDCGGGLVATLQAYRIIVARPRTYNILWVCSAEEDVSGKDGFSRVLPLLPPVDVAIVGEPTAMQPATAEKGLMVVDGYAHGVSGHAARYCPPDGEGTPKGDGSVNAIYEALDDLVWLRNYRFRKDSQLLGPTKMTVTVVESGTQHNVVPDLLHFVLDVRTNEFYQNEYLFEFLRKHMKKCELKARSFRLHSSCISHEHPLVQRCLGMGMVPFGSPTLSDQALMPFPSLKLGPGESSRSHTADEFIKLSEIRQAIDIYVRLLDGLEIGKKRE